MASSSPSSPLTRRASLAAFASSLLACRRTPPAAGMRVVSLAPSMTESLHAIGAGPLLVGRTTHCDRPAEVRSLPSVGGYAEPDVERVLGLAPTLVVGERGPAGPSLEERLRGHGIATFFPPTTTVAEVGAMLVGLGQRVGRAAEGEGARANLEASIARIASWSRERPSVSAVMVFDAKPLFVAGPGGFPDELLRLAGGTNAVTGGGAFPTLDVERLLALDPAVIVDATDTLEGPSRLIALEGWERLSAVRAGRVRKLASDAAMRPGPRLAEGLLAVVRALHGEVPALEVPRADGGAG